MKNIVLFGMLGLSLLLVAGGGMLWFLNREYVSSAVKFIASERETPKEFRQPLGEAPLTDITGINQDANLVKARGFLDSKSDIGFCLRYALQKKCLTFSGEAFCNVTIKDVNKNGFSEERTNALLQSGAIKAIEGADYIWTTERGRFSCNGWLAFVQRGDVINSVFDRLTSLASLATVSIDD